MSNLSIQSITMPAADLGLENPLIPIEIPAPSKKLEFPPDLPDEMSRNIACGNLSSIYPYTYQDEYDRNLTDRSFQVAVLENEYLRATFLLEFGGRLWSLLHKPTGKELLEVNPVFQLANLALRNAWFSGGVEWNIGTTGHSPFTCSPLFSCRVEGKAGTPILRFYEWERFRQTPFQIDAFLPDGSQVLFIHTRIFNPNDHSVPIYWWSNIAVPDTAGTRVLVPAKSAYCLGCRPNYLSKIDVPINNGIDITYPKIVDGAADFFFELEPTRYPWIAALNGDGEGLIQLSTREMIGRKLWVWGSTPGGRNWQKFLSPPGKGYIEIQSGITRTQLEHKQLDPDTGCSWLEGYAYLDADPRIVHGRDWTHAFTHVDQQVQRLLPFEDLLQQYQLSSSYLELPPVENYQKGSGWGALERKRRERFSGNEFVLGGIEFGDDSLGEFQKPWLSLLETGSFSQQDEKKVIGSFVVSRLWGKMIEQALQGKSENNWFAWYQAGITRYHAGDVSGAVEAWEQSIELNWTPWATRNLALLAWRNGNINRAADLFIEACKPDSNLLPLVVECGACLGKAGRHEEWLQILQALPQSMQENGRIRLLHAQAALAAGNLEIVEKFFKKGTIVADLREGDNSISDLWIDWQTQKMCHEEDLDPGDPKVIHFRDNPPLPGDIDFRMRK